MAQEINEEKEGLTTQFKIVIPKIREMIFKSCEGIESEIEVAYFSDGGTLSAARTARGPQRVNKISFAQGTSATESGKGIFDWYLEVCDTSKPLQKETISVIVMDREQKTLAEWRILNAWPCRWTAPMMSRDFSSLAVESVTFAHEGIERKK